MINIVILEEILRMEIGNFSFSIERGFKYSPKSFPSEINYVKTLDFLKMVEQKVKNIKNFEEKLDIYLFLINTYEEYFRSKKSKFISKNQNGYIIEKNILYSLDINGKKYEICNLNIKNIDIEMFKLLNSLKSFI